MTLSGHEIGAEANFFRPYLFPVIREVSVAQWLEKLPTNRKVLVSKSAQAVIRSYREKLLDTKLKQKL